MEKTPAIELKNITKTFGTKVIANKNHETTEGHFIRFTTYVFEGRYYVVTMFNGTVMTIAEKDDIREMIEI